MHHHKTSARRFGFLAMRFRSSLDPSPTTFVLTLLASTKLARTLSSPHMAAATGDGDRSSSFLDQACGSVFNLSLLMARTDANFLHLCFWMDQLLARRGGSRLRVVCEVVHVLVSVGLLKRFVRSALTMYLRHCCMYAGTRTIDLLSNRLPRRMFKFDE
jgi:hypothetical protein